MRATHQHPHSGGRSRGRSHGFTLLELVVVICILGILGAVLADRLYRVAEIAEKSAMETTASTINTALLFEFAGHILDGTRGQIAPLLNANPVEMLAQKPANYLGELHQPPDRPDPAGNWYYDPVDHLLVYLVRRGDEFQPDSAGLKRVRYQVRLQYDTRLPGLLTGVVLSPVEPYKWLQSSQ